MDCETTPSPSSARTGDSSVVTPPSTSFDSAVDPGFACCVMKAVVPGAGVASSSGCTAFPPDVVPTGSTRTHRPFVAVSPPTPSDQPRATSASSANGAGSRVRSAVPPTPASSTSRVSAGEYPKASAVTTC